LLLVLPTHSMTALRTLRLLAYAIALVPVSLSLDPGSHLDALNLSSRPGLVSWGVALAARTNPSLLSQFQLFKKQAFQAIGHTRDAFSKRSFSSRNWPFSHFIPREVTNGHVLPYENVWLTNNSAVACMNQCATFGYPVAGVEVRPYTS